MLDKYRVSVLDAFVLAVEELASAVGDTMCVTSVTKMYAHPRPATTL